MCRFYRSELKVLMMYGESGDRNLKKKKPSCNPEVLCLLNLIIQYLNSINSSTSTVTVRNPKLLFSQQFIYVTSSELICIRFQFRLSVFLLLTLCQMKNWKHA